MLKWDLAGVGRGVTKKKSIYAKKEVFARGWQWPTPKMAWVKMSHGKRCVLAVAVVVLRNADCRRVGG